MVGGSNSSYHVEKEKQMQESTETVKMEKGRKEMAKRGKQ